MIAVSDVVLVYLLPVAFLFAVWLAISLVIYVG